MFIKKDLLTRHFTYWFAQAIYDIIGTEQLFANFIRARHSPH